MLREQARSSFMIAHSNTYELTGIIDEDHHLVINEEFPVNGPQKVRVYVIVEDPSEPSEKEFLMAAQKGGGFDFWNDPEEDIYSLEDGKSVE